MPFVMLRNDSLDRFGTRLEQRFSKQEIRHMLGEAGFDLSTLIFRMSNLTGLSRLGNPKHQST